MRPGEDVAIVPGTSDYGPGRNRVSFLVVDKQSRLIERPTARVWIARGLKQKPFAETTAKLEPIGVPGGAKADAQNIYVTTVDTPTPGNVLASRRARRRQEDPGAREPRRPEAAVRTRRSVNARSPRATRRCGRASITEDRHDGRAARPGSPPHDRGGGDGGEAAVRGHVRDAALLSDAHVRPGRPGRAVGRQELAGQRCRLHPHRDLQGQRPGQGDEPLGERVEAPERAVHVRRRSDGRDPDPARGRVQPRGARGGRAQGRAS